MWDARSTREGEKATRWFRARGRTKCAGAGPVTTAAPVPVTTAAGAAVVATDAAPSAVATDAISCVARMLKGRWWR